MQVQCTFGLFKRRKKWNKRNEWERERRRRSEGIQRRVWTRTPRCRYPNPTWAIACTEETQHNAPLFRSSLLNETAKYYKLYWNVNVCCLHWRIRWLPQWTSSWSVLARTVVIQNEPLHLGLGSAPRLMCSICDCDYYTLTLLITYLCLRLHETARP